MLLYIPTITMGIWADERKQGTDELLLTIPATDFDIVLGKYLAALGIFTVSLLFSLVCNYLVLNNLATSRGLALLPGFGSNAGVINVQGVDFGLFLGTYAGYWLVGLAMLGIGLTASLLTGNVTIGFVLGVLFNVPLVVLLPIADVVLSALRREEVLTATRWSIGGQMHDFSRGILSLSGTAYFFLILAVMLYVSMVLIGRRHWKIDRFVSARRFVFGVLALVIVAPVLSRLASPMVANPGATSFLVLKWVWLVAAILLCAAVTWKPIRRYVLWTLAGLVAGAVLCGLFLLIVKCFFPAVMAVLPLTGSSLSLTEIIVIGTAAPLFFTVLLRPLVLDYFYRTISLTAIAVVAVLMLHHHDLRLDVTSERLSSLSPETRKLIADLRTERPVLIEAFISPSVPEAYVQTRLNLLAALKELRAIGGDKLTVKIHDTDRYSDEAALAEKRYGIQPHQVMSLNRGALSVDQIFLNVAVSRGSSRPIPPAFIDQDTPIEYELVRSIGTVTEQKRKKLGVLNTDAQLYGQLNFQTMSPSPNWPIIDELEKQYDVVRVDPSKPITEKYDVLLAVQPSTLGPAEMNNFVAAVAAGQPTAIFEDPAPVLSGVSATSQPRQPPGGMNPMMRMQRPPKATSTSSGTCWASISPIRKSSGRVSTPTRKSPTSPTTRSSSSPTSPSAPRRRSSRAISCRERRSM